MVRTIGLAAAVVGLLLVCFVVLWGRDPRRVALTGPVWRRRLLGAGLALLGAFGIPSCGRDDASAAPPSNDPRPSTATDKGDAAVSLKDAAGWRRINAAWNEAQEIASGKRGPYPFDQAGQKRVLASIENAAKEADALQGKALLSDAEAGLVKVELGHLAYGVREKRPTEMRMATCYEPLPLCFGAMQSAQRLAARLPLLEKLAASQRVQPIVAHKVLAAVEADLATLADPKQTAGYPAADKPKMEENRKAAAAVVTRLKAAMGE